MFAEFAYFAGYSLVLFRTLRGRPTFRSLTASRSFGSISHSRPNLNAFKRFALIIARTLFAVTSNRFAASVVVMIFMVQSIAFCKIVAWRHNFLDKRKFSLHSARTKQSGLAVAVNDNQPYTIES